MYFFPFNALMRRRIARWKALFLFVFLFFELQPPQSRLQGLLKVHTSGYLEVALSCEMICRPMTHSLQRQSTSAHSISLKWKSCSHCRAITRGTKEAQSPHSSHWVAWRGSCVGPVVLQVVSRFAELITKESPSCDSHFPASVFWALVETTQLWTSHLNGFNVFFS